MVLGEDGVKMSKSRGNIIDTDEIIAKYGADVFRQWSAASATTGSDIMFSWNDIIAAARFQTKLWNILRFAIPHISGTTSSDVSSVSELADKWLLIRLSETIFEVNDAMEHFQFDNALKSIREFTWTVLADQYIELIKGRLYMDIQSSESGRVALRIALDALCRMLAPISPHFAEECYHYLTGTSVHEMKWVDFSYEDPMIRKNGELLVAVVSELRRLKHEKGIALNAPFGSVTIYSDSKIDDGGDAARALNAQVQWRTERPIFREELEDKA
jgi:valyl-tRNA synthetase